MVDSNLDNVHNADLIAQVMRKIDRLTELIPLIELELLKSYVYLKLLEVLSHESGRIYGYFKIFIDMIFEAKATVTSYGSEILEFIILYFILKRLQNYDLFRSYVRECIDIRADESIVLVCLNGRVSRYIASLCYSDEDEVLGEPMRDEKEIKCHRLTKFYYFFHIELKKHPTYYAAYNCTAELPDDYEDIMVMICNKVMEETGEYLDFEISDILG